MSSIAAISSASSSTASISLEVETSNSTSGKNASFSQRSRKAFYSLAKSVSARTVGLFALRTPEFSPHFPRSAPNSPRSSSKLARGPIPHFSTRAQTPLPRIVITPADDDEESSEPDVEPLTDDSSQEFPDLFWPYKDSFEQNSQKKFRRDRPFFGIKRASMAFARSSIQRRRSVASEASDQPDSIPTPSESCESNRCDTLIEENKQNKQTLTSPMNVGVIENSSYDSMSTAEINFMLGKIRRAHKSRCSAEYTDDYADSEMSRSECEHNSFVKSSPTAARPLPVVTAQ